MTSMDIDKRNSKTSGCGIWRESLVTQTREFLENSSLHGVRYLTAETGRHPCERVMWIIFLSVGFGASGLIIASLWDKFQTSPTITGLDADFHDWDVTFPAATLCPTYPVNSDLLRQYLTKSSNASNSDILWTENTLRMITNLSFNGLQYLTNISNIPGGNSLRKTIKKITYKCPDIFETCSWKLKPLDCCKYFYPTFTENGFCFAFNSLTASNEKGRNGSDLLPQNIYETDPAWAITFKSTFATTNPLKLYIHAWDEAITRESRPQHVWGGTSRRLAFSLKHTYTTEDARQLSIQQRKCVFDDEISLLTSKKYSYSSCMQQCRVLRAFEYCGCVPHFSPYTENYRFCRVEELTCLALFSEELNDIGRCPCELGCNHLIYEVEKLTDISSGENGILEVGFVSWPMIRYKREVLFGWVDLLVSFGGIAGLFLGFSLLSGVEILYYFSMRAACYAIKNKKQQNNQQTKTICTGGILKKRKGNKILPIKKQVVFAIDDHLNGRWAVKTSNNPRHVVQKPKPLFHMPYLN